MQNEENAWKVCVRPGLPRSGRPVGALLYHRRRKCPCGATATRRKERFIDLRSAFFSKRATRAMIGASFEGPSSLSDEISDSEMTILAARCSDLFRPILKLRRSDRRARGRGRG